MDKDSKLFCTIIIILSVFLLINNICGYLNQNDFKIFFVDVGQGDCTLIKTKLNKTILIDSGEGCSNKIDKGKQVVYPYLLDRKIKTIDYLILSHFDSDHCDGFKYLLNNLDEREQSLKIQKDDRNSFIISKHKEGLSLSKINEELVENGYKSMSKPGIKKVIDKYNSLPNKSEEPVEIIYEEPQEIVIDFSDYFKRWANL